MPLLQGTFVLVKAADLMPSPGTRGSTIRDPADAAAIPWRLRQVSAVQLPWDRDDPAQRWTCSPDAVLELAGGETVRADDVLEEQLRDCVLCRTGDETQMWLDDDVTGLVLTGEVRLD